MKKWMLIISCMLFFTGCMTASKQETAGTPITNIRVENYFSLGENVQYFSEIPFRVLVIGASQTETLLDMGVEDSILWSVKYEDDKKYPIKECNQAAFRRLNFLPQQQVTMERVLDMAPDMIISEESWFSKNRLGSTDYWNSKGIHTLVSLNTTSPGKINQPETVEREIKYIRDLGVIYHKEKQAENIVTATLGRFEEVRKRVKGQKAPKVMILDLLSPTISYGRNKIAGDIAAKLGGVVPDTTAVVSDEVIMKENPDIVFVITYDDEETRLAYLRNKKAFGHLNFIREGRIYEIPLKYAYGPMTRVIDAAGYMAGLMYPGQFDFPKEYDFYAQN